MSNKSHGQVVRPVVDRAAEANVNEVVRQIQAEKPKDETLIEKVKKTLEG